MTDSHGALKAALQSAQAKMEKGRTPDFDDVWEAASSRAALVRIEAARACRVGRSCGCCSNRVWLVGATRG